MSWQVQEAKQRLSELLRAAEAGEPQIISRHGRDVAAVVDIAWFREAAGVEVSFADFLRHGPGLDGVEIVRADSVARTVELE